RGGAAGIRVRRDEAVTISQVLVVAAHLVQQVRVLLVVATDRGWGRLQDDATLIVVLVERGPFLARGRVVVNLEHGLGGKVRVNDVAVAVWQRLDGLLRPTVIAWAPIAIQTV